LFSLNHLTVPVILSDIKITCKNNSYTSTPFIWAGGGFTLEKGPLLIDYRTR
jgi:hypothetical protein